MLNIFLSHEEIHAYMHRSTKAEAFITHTEMVLKLFDTVARYD